MCRAAAKSALAGGRALRYRRGALPVRSASFSITGNAKPMKSNHNPTLQDRQAAAAKSRQKALDALRAKPPIDEAIVAARAEAQAKREAAAAEKRAAKIAEQEAIAAAKAAAIAEAAKAPPPPSLPTAAEMKAARDARYAARKNRK